MPMEFFANGWGKFHGFFRRKSMDWFKFVGEHLNNHGFSHVFIMGSPVIFAEKKNPLRK
jgi:hypothetical protein